MSNLSTTSQTTITVPAEPAILSANTYFWGAASTASNRRRNEERRQAEVAAYFEALGFEVERSGDNVFATGHGLEIKFHFSESCTNVYKSLSVSRNGKASNITAIRKVAAQIVSSATIAQAA
jgi:hypothetical protein